MTENIRSSKIGDLGQCKICTTSRDSLTGNGAETDISHDPSGKTTSLKSH